MCLYKYSADDVLPTTSFHLDGHPKTIRINLFASRCANDEPNGERYYYMRASNGPDGMRTVLSLFLCSRFLFVFLFFFSISSGTSFCDDRLQSDRIRRTSFDEMIYCEVR